MKFQHRFRVKAPLAAVADFHSRSASMPAITPPPMIVRVHAAPARLTSGDVMDFTLWAGPVPLRWVVMSMLFPSRVITVRPSGCLITRVSEKPRAGSVWINVVDPPWVCRSALAQLVARIPAASAVPASPRPGILTMSM